MTALDGNAAAGVLRDVFGVEGTTAIGECAHRGRARLAETASFLRGPGIVLRCRTCAGVVLVVTEVRGTNCVDISGLRDLEVPRA